MPRVQNVPHLRCRKCDGQGFIPVPSIIEAGHQAGEQTCPLCGGDGTKRDRIRLAPVHRLAKKKKQIELLELEQEIRTYVQDRDLAFCLGFNDHQDGLIIYENHHWLSEDDKHKAIRESSIWSLEIYGQGIEASLLSVVRFFRTCERVD